MQAFTRSGVDAKRPRSGFTAGRFWQVLGRKVPSEQRAAKPEIYYTFRFLNAKLFHHWSSFALFG